MGSVFGKNLTLSIFGESHGPSVGVVIDGFPSGMKLDFDQISREMERRAPKKVSYSTTRCENDQPEILSGILDHKTTGAPICAVIRNSDAHSSDYSMFRDVPRPSHADYTAALRYQGANDIRGGGHFSGRLMAPLVFAGALCKQYLHTKGITIGAHIAEIGGIVDDRFSDLTLTPSLLSFLNSSDFPVMNSDSNQRIHEKIDEAVSNQDSLGGIIECAVLGFPSGVGNPIFRNMESVISSMLFSIPAVKGVEFGEGFGFSKLTGSEANDRFLMENGRVITNSNHNGGINGGITNGMPVVLRAVIKPVSSIAKKQETLNLKTKQIESLKIPGRHDVCLVPRAVCIVEAAVAVSLLDLMLEANGYANT